MKTVLLSQFGEHPISTLKDAQRLGEAFVILFKGKPIARVDPIPGRKGQRRLGELKGMLSIKGDIVHVDWSEDWECLQ